MKTPRAVIAAAMIAKLKTLQPAFTTVSRVWKDADSAAMQELLPMLTLVDLGYEVKSNPGMPYVFDCSYDAYIVVKNPDDPDVEPQTITDPILDALDTLFAPDDPSGKCTLGGIVEWVKISGRIDVQYGYLAGAASFLAIPLHVRSTNLK